jgi:hypothetical protein
MKKTSERYGGGGKNMFPSPLSPEFKKMVDLYLRSTEPKRRELENKWEIELREREEKGRALTRKGATASINQWADLYLHQATKLEFDNEWGKFEGHSKILQASLCVAAKSWGFSEKDIYWKLGGDKNHEPTHDEYVQKVSDYFCTGENAFDKEVVQLITSAAIQ